MGVVTARHPGPGIGDVDWVLAAHPDGRSEMTDLCRLSEAGSTTESEPGYGRCRAIFTEPTLLRILIRCADAEFWSTSTLLSPTVV